MKSKLANVSKNPHMFKHIIKSGQVKFNFCVFCLPQHGTAFISLHGYICVPNNKWVLF